MGRELRWRDSPQVLREAASEPHHCSPSLVSQTTLCQVHFWKVLQDGLRVLLRGADTPASQELFWPDIATDRKNRST